MCKWNSMSISYVCFQKKRFPQLPFHSDLCTEQLSSLSSLDASIAPRYIYGCSVRKCEWQRTCVLWVDIVFIKRVSTEGTFSWNQLYERRVKASNHKDVIWLDKSVGFFLLTGLPLSSCLEGFFFFVVKGGFTPPPS